MAGKVENKKLEEYENEKYYLFCFDFQVFVVAFYRRRRL